MSHGDSIDRKSNDAARKTRIFTAVLTGALYVFACVTPVGGDPEPEYIGFHALLLGWIVGLPWSNFRAGFPGIVPWSANWMLLAGCVFLIKRSYYRATILGTLASVLALFSWGTSIPRLLVGYYFWHISMVVLLGGALICQRHVVRFQTVIKT